MSTRIRRRSDLEVGQQLRDRQGQTWTVLGMRQRGGRYGTTWVGIKTGQNVYNEVDWQVLRGWEVVPPAEGEACIHRTAT
jgi:hypothetical protein